MVYVCVGSSKRRQDDAREPGPERRSALETPQWRYPEERRFGQRLRRPLYCEGWRVPSLRISGATPQTFLESFPSYDLRSSFHDVVGLVAWRLAGGWSHAPFSRSENGQGLADCCRIGPANETRGSRCVGHWRSPFLCRFQKQACVKARFAKQSVIYAFCFQWKGSSGRSAKCGEHPISRYSWQRFDGNVEVVTYIQVRKHRRVPSSA